MIKHVSNPGFRTRVLSSALLAICACVRSADTPATLKNAYQDYFPVGTAINRSLATGTSFRWSPEQVSKDIALVKEHFNQLVAENDMKWALIHPREGSEGFDFGQADAFVNFGPDCAHREENMLIWHTGHKGVWNL